MEIHSRGKNGILTPGSGSCAGERTERLTATSPLRANDQTLGEDKAADRRPATHAIKELIPSAYPRPDGPYPRITVKSSKRIDPIVAAIMAISGIIRHEKEPAIDPDELMFA